MFINALKIIKIYKVSVSVVDFYNIGNRPCTFDLVGSGSKEWDKNLTSVFKNIGAQEELSVLFWSSKDWVVQILCSNWL